MMNLIRTRKFALPCLFSLLLAAVPRGASAEAPRSTGQVVYVSAYSTIFYGDRERQFNLATTLSIRNTDLTEGLTVEKIEYIGQDGKPIRAYAKEPVRLAPLEVEIVVVRASDTAGGAEASFLVTWRSAKPVSPPLVETVMIGTQTQQGISFTSRGVVVRELGE